MLGITLAQLLLWQQSQQRIQKLTFQRILKSKKKQFGFERDSVVLLEQLRTIDKARILEKITQVDAEFMQTINEGLKVSLGLE